MTPLWRRLLTNQTLRTKLQQRRPNIFQKLFVPMQNESHDDVDELDARDDVLLQHIEGYALLTLAPHLRAESSIAQRIDIFKQIVTTHAAQTSIPFLSKSQSPIPSDPSETDHLVRNLTASDLTKFHQHTMNILAKLPRDKDSHVHRSIFIVLMEHWYQLLLPGLLKSHARCLGRADFVELCEDRRTMSPEKFYTSMLFMAQLWCREGASSGHGDELMSFIDLMNAKLFDESRCELVVVLYGVSMVESGKTLPRSPTTSESPKSPWRRQSTWESHGIRSGTPQLPQLAPALVQPEQRPAAQAVHVKDDAHKIAYSGSLAKAMGNWDRNFYHAKGPHLDEGLVRKIKNIKAYNEKEKERSTQKIAISAMTKTKRVDGRRTTSPTHRSSMTRSVSPEGLEPHPQDLQLQWIARARALGVSVRDFCNPRDIDHKRFSQWLAYEATDSKKMRREVKRFIENGEDVSFDKTVDSQALTVSAAFALREEWRQRAIHEGLDYESFCTFFNVPRKRFLQWYDNPNDLSPDVQRSVTRYVFLSPDIQTRWKNCAERRKVSPVMFCASHPFGMGHFMHWLEGGTTTNPQILSAVWEFLRGAGEEGTAPLNHRQEPQLFPNREKYSIERAIGALPMRHAEHEVNPSCQHKAVRSLIDMMKENTIPVRHQARIRNALMMNEGGKK